jgi:hypothetical protein
MRRFPTHRHSFVTAVLHDGQEQTGIHAGDFKTAQAIA